MKVQELLTDESKWIKGAFVRDENDPKARKWCLVGAISRCYRDSTPEIVKKVENHLGGSIPRWNDASETTFSDVEKLIKELDI